jgi:hypothetical protein
VVNENFKKQQFNSEDSKIFIIHTMQWAQYLEEKAFNFVQADINLISVVIFFSEIPPLISAKILKINLG